MKTSIRSALPLASVLLLACASGTDPVPTPDPVKVESLALSNTDPWCADFVQQHEPDGTFPLRMDAVLPADFQADSGDYLVLKIFGYDPNMADVPACEYHASKVHAKNIEVTGGTVSFAVSARLDTSLGNYFGIEGFKAWQGNAEDGVFRRNLPPVQFEMGKSEYRFDGLAEVEP